jgi:hypothetical protein
MLVLRVVEPLLHSKPYYSALLTFLQMAWVFKLVTFKYNNRVHLYESTEDENQEGAAFTSLTR